MRGYEESEGPLSEKTIEAKIMSARLLLLCLKLEDEEHVRLELVKTLSQKCGANHERTLFQKVEYGKSLIRSHN